MLISTFFRVALEGDTIDGRTIERQHIEEMAATYDPLNTYNARVNMEHFQGLVPGGPFDALGDVVALEAREESGKNAGKLGLYAQIKPLPKLIEMTRAGQKLHTSIELFKNFARTGKAYLTGLAVTDTPASLGTEMLAFSAGGFEAIAGAAHAFTLEMDGEAGGEADKPGLFTRVKELLSGKAKTDAARFADMDAAIGEIAQAVASLSGQDHGIAALAEKLAATESALDDLKAAHAKLASDFAALSAKLEDDLDPNHQGRQPATGGNGLIATDC